MINDRARLLELLPVYFETKRIRSFYRQLYNYKFKSLKYSDTKSHYTNPSFERGKYSNMIGLRRNVENSEHQQNEYNIKLEYKMLYKKYQHCIKAALVLKADIQEHIEANKQQINEQMEFKYNFAQRMKMGLMFFVIQSKYYDRDCDLNVRELAQEHHSVKPPLSQEEIDRILWNKRLPEIIRSYVNSVFLSPFNSSIYLSSIVKVMLRYVNNRFFNISFDIFYKVVVLYVLNKQEPWVLQFHSNFCILKEIKELVDEYYDVTISSYVDSRFINLFESCYNEYPCEFLMNEVESLRDMNNDRYSVRSLNDQLLLNQVDMFSFFSSDYDEI